MQENTCAAHGKIVDLTKGEIAVALVDRHRRGIEGVQPGAMAGAAGGLGLVKVEQAAGQARAADALVQP